MPLSSRRREPPDDDDDDDDFTFNRLPRKNSEPTTNKQIRQPVEHDEEAPPSPKPCTSRSTPLDCSPPIRKITVSPVSAEKYCADVTGPLTPDVMLLREMHRVKLRNLSECMGQVTYGTPEKICIIADYWGEIADSKHKKRSTKNVPVYDMETDSEGVLLNKALFLDPRLCYHYPLSYYRITPASLTRNPASASESIKAVGLGQFGKVYRTIDRRTKQEFADKLVSIEQFSKNEIKIHSQLEHPHIVKFYGAIRTKKSVHIFMQFAGGGSIHQLLKDGRGFVGSGSIDKHLFTEYWSVYYFKQVLQALFYLHSKNIVHCDLKPNNVVLSSDYRNCYLTDFGEARIVQNNVGYVQLEKLVGTHNYISPEAIEKNEYYYASDIWSVACFFLHMLTGKVPWTIKHPGLGIYLFAITQRPFGILDEIPTWTSSLTQSILRSSFEEVKARKSLREMQQLTTKNLSILIYTRQSTKDTRSFSNPENLESFEERSVSAEISSSVRESSVQSSFASGNLLESTIVPTVATVEASSSVPEPAGASTYDMYGVSSSVSPPSLSLSEPQDVGDRARVNALLDTASSDSFGSTSHSHRNKASRINEIQAGDTSSLLRQNNSLPVETSISNGPPSNLSTTDGEAVLNGLVDDEIAWNKSADPTELEELNEILRQSAIEPESAVNDQDAFNELSSILEGFDTELKLDETTVKASGEKTRFARDSPCTSSQCLSNGGASVYRYSPSTYDEDIDLSSPDLVSRECTSDDVVEKPCSSSYQSTK